jgi:hypothetical protein
VTALGYQDAVLIAVGLAVDAVSVALLSWEYTRLVSKGYTPAMPFSVFHTAVPATKPGLVAAFGLLACLAPFEEEAVFRVVPHMIGGLPFAAAGTVAWVLAHYHKLYASNTHLSADALRSFGAAYIASLALPGAFYAYSVSVNPLIPYLLHATHNSLVVLNMYRMAKPPKAESKLLKPVGEQQQQQRRQGGAEGGGGKPAPAAPPRAWAVRYRLDRYAFSAPPAWAEEWLEAGERERRKRFK